MWNGDTLLYFFHVVEGSITARPAGPAFTKEHIPDPHKELGTHVCALIGADVPVHTQIYGGKKVS